MKFQQLITGLFLIIFMQGIAQKTSPINQQIYRYGQIIPCISLPGPDVQNLINQDKITEKDATPYRFGQIIPTQIDVLKSGNWVYVVGEGSYLRLIITSADAKALIPYYNKINIPAGSRLCVDNPSKTFIKSSYIAGENESGFSYATETIPGDSILIEYFQPSGTQYPTEIQLSGIAYAYKDVYGTNDFGHAGKCEVNAICSEGNNWQNQKKGIVRILVKNGAATYWCSGALINNTLQDKTPYLLTAFHCGNGAGVNDISQWQFYFNFESQFCANPIVQPNFQKITGAQKVASSKNISQLDSDFLLLKLNQNVPDTYKPYYCGWNAEDIGSATGVAIHHPQGDIKKISTYTSPLISSNWSGTPNTHWKVSWVKTTNGHGVTEGGSSGSPLFNSQGKLIGTLTGGDASCDSIYLTKPDYFGKLWYHWDKTGTVDSLQLRPWLDPQNSGILDMNGLLISSVNDFKAANIILSPNPATDVIQLQLSTPLTHNSILKVYDVSGKPVLTQSLTTSSQFININIEDLPAGIYIMLIQTSKESFQARFIKR
ncbi:MAG: T9SS type A sorting domain-containing protein [Bacteroidales bacterium]|nr:T9SS type A sorting domain-containing protein [Bacteroidales bacterium]